MTIVMHFDTIFELNTGNDFWQSSRRHAIQPSLLHAFGEFEHHRQNAGSVIRTRAADGAPDPPTAHRNNSRLDHFRGS